MNEQIENINIAISYLKDREILTSLNKDKFILKNDKIYHYFNSNCVVLTLEDFKDLYKDNIFYLYKEDDVLIDNDKDEAYYRYYRK